MNLNDDFDDPESIKISEKIYKIGTDQLKGDNKMNLNEYRDECHKTAVEKGFWEADKTIAVKLMLIVTEIAEAMESYRENNRANFDEEIADTLIRVLDLCGHLDIDIQLEVLAKMQKNFNRPYKHNKVC